MRQQLTVIIEKEGDGYVSFCPALDIASQGKTVEEARENLREALELFFAHASDEEIQHRLNEDMNTAIKNLPVEERIRLVEEIWDTIAADQGALELTEAQRGEIDLRLDSFDKDGLFGAEATTVMERIRKKL